MADDNSLTKHLMNLKEQILRFAAEKEHTHLTSNITDAYSKLAKKNHADTSNSFGAATSSKYGHVKLIDNVIEENSDTEDASSTVKSSGIYTAINNAITTLRTEIDNIVNDKIYFVTEHLEEWENDTIEDIDKKEKYAIPTAKAVWDAIENYDNLFIGVSLDKPKVTSSDIDNIKTPGYYKSNNPTRKTFNYGNQSIYYDQGLIKVEKADDRIIQHVHATELASSGNNSYYKLNGCEYRRYYANGEWKEWHVAHIPYRSIAPISHSGPGIDNNSIQIFENTAGFIFHWDQNATDDDRYNIQAPLYEYAEICTFSQELPIRGPYVFSNLIGRMDIKITSTGMYIRSNVQPGGRIIEMHETYFVPRNR